MGVENSGILFLGRKSDELDLSLLEGFDPESDYVLEEGLREAIWVWALDHDSKLRAQPNNAYECRFMLIGFELADSGSYGCKELVPDELADTCMQDTLEFVQLFTVQPRLYLMNYQY